MSVGMEVVLPAFEELAALDDLAVIDADPVRFAANALVWYLVPTLISPDRPDSNFWPGLTAVLAAGSAVKGTPGGMGSALGLGAVTFLWLTRGNAKLW